MTVTPELKTENLDYIFSAAKSVSDESRDRRSGTEGERKMQSFCLNELKKYSDEASAENFTVHPGAGTIIQKILCALLILCVVLFYEAQSSGNVFFACVTVIISLVCFCIFAYKFIFDGTKLNCITRKKSSLNVFAKRYAANTPRNRVVLVSHADSPKKLRAYFFGSKAPLVLAVCSVIGNTFTFCSVCLFLISGAPENTKLFSVLAAMGFVFAFFYLCDILLTDPRKPAPGITASVLPSLTLISIMKQLSDNSFRFTKTEVCCLITGAEYSSHAGAYAFAEKYKRVFKDIPTVFIPLEEITTSKNLSVFFGDGSGTHGSSETASIIAEAADNLGINVTKESTLLGTSTFTPFTINHFESCSFGTSKKHISKSLTGSADTLRTASRKAVLDCANILLETLNYYDDPRL